MKTWGGQRQTRGKESRIQAGSGRISPHETEFMRQIATPLSRILLVAPAITLPALAWILQ